MNDIKKRIYPFIIKNGCLFLALIISGIFLSNLLIRYSITDEKEIQFLHGNIIQFSGIFSALLITFIVSKVIQIRQEKLERKKEIIRFSNRITDFRRIANILKNCREFWEVKTLSEINGQYNSLTLYDIKCRNFEEEIESNEKLIDAFIKNELDYYLYLDIKSLILDNHGFQTELYDDYEHNYTYSLEILEQWKHAHNGSYFWYCLNHKRDECIGKFHFGAFNIKDRNEIINLCIKINPQKYQGAKLNDELLASVGSEFHDYILPRTYELSYINSLKLPQPLRFLLNILFVTIVSGVLIPLILSSAKLGINIKLYALNFAIWSLCMSIIYFLLRFNTILNNEVRVR